MYKVSLEMPKYCNKCPFGMCNYSFPLAIERYQDKYFSSIDGEANERGTYGYVCNLQFNRFRQYKSVQRAKVGEDIKKPDWCYLIKCEE